MKTIKMKWTGIRPLVMHNGLLADPTNPHVVAIKKITAKGSKKMTTADHEERDRLEWIGGLYWSESIGGIAIPSDNLERCIQEGAKKQRLGKDFAAAVFVDSPEVELNHRLRGKPKDQMRVDPAYTLRKGCKVQLSRIIRIRPMVPPGWSLSIGFEFDETIVNEKDVIEAAVQAGATAGLGDWRPKFGRFTVEVVK